jgi:tetratricopeptide (TPR) repeat protein
LSESSKIRREVEVGFRMRKSMKIAPGVRLSVSKSGVGASVGGKGARYSAHSSGRRTTTVGSGVVPGVYYQRSKGGGSRSGSSQAQQAAPPSPKKPGMFAPKGEKELYKAIKAQDVKAIKSVGVYYKDFLLPSYSLAGLMLLTDEPAEAEQLLSEAFATGKDPAEDKFVSSYLRARLELSLAQGVTAQLPVNRDAVGLALAELKQDQGDLEGAIDVVEQLEPTTYSAVSLAELYALTERWDDVIELTKGMKNEDDASALLCMFRGQAFRFQGFHDAAHEALKEALRSKSRAAPIRHMALAERAQNYLAQGKKGMARKDLERILAEDSGYPNVHERLAELTA